jgi:hypothetical protein
VEERTTIHVAAESLQAGDSAPRPETPRKSLGKWQMMHQPMNKLKTLLLVSNIKDKINPMMLVVEHQVLNNNNQMMMVQHQVISKINLIMTSKFKKLRKLKLMLKMAIKILKKTKLFLEALLRISKPVARNEWKIH